LFLRRFLKVGAVAVAPGGCSARRECAGRGDHLRSYTTLMDLLTRKVCGLGEHMASRIHLAEPRARRAGVGGVLTLGTSATLAIFGGLAFRGERPALGGTMAQPSPSRCWRVGRTPTLAERADGDRGAGPFRTDPAGEGVRQLGTKRVICVFRTSRKER